MPNTRTRIAQPKEENVLDQGLDPTAINAEVGEAIAAATKVEVPPIELPPDDYVELPGGMMYQERLIKSAIVRELTGKDEELLAKAANTTNSMFHFVDRLLRCGVERLGDEPPSQTDQLLKKLLIGDREFLILSIRRATYGEHIEIHDWVCPFCESKSELTMDVADIPIKEVANPEDTFRVDLRKGGYALCRLATGEDQLAVFEKKDLTEAQRQSILLTKCLISIMDEDDMEHTIAAFPSMVREISMADRHAILRQLAERQPGPQYANVEYKCEDCGEEVKVAVGLGHLFPDIGWI